MAADKDKSDAKSDASKPHEPPKPVHIGGETLVDRLLPHIKKILVGAIMIAVVLGIIFGIRAYKQSKQEQSTEKFAAVMRTSSRPVVSKAEAEQLKMETFADHKERATAVLADLNKYGTGHTTAAFRGGIHLDNGELEKAIEEFKKGENDKELDGVLAREGLGIALESKAAAEKTDAAKRQQLYTEALDAFNRMQPAEDGPRRAYALYHIGRIQLKLGKTAEAKASFQKAKTLGADTLDLGELIERRLANLGES
jgi:predicted negative regulator of RcsB-dependent stress response